MNAKEIAAPASRRCDPTIPLTDPAFVYTPSVQTDVRRVFYKTDPNWPFGVLDPKVVARRRWEAARHRARERQMLPDALL